MASMVPESGFCYLTYTTASFHHFRSDDVVVFNGLKFSPIVLESWLIITIAQQHRRYCN